MANQASTGQDTPSINELLAEACLTREVDDYEEDDYTPAPRDAFHSDTTLCKDILRTITASSSLAIRSSTISMGSGLFTKEDIPDGREIYRSNPLISCVDAGNPSICHNCLQDTAEVFKKGGNGETTKACTGCLAARFCSKKCQRAAWTKFHKDECKILRENPQMGAHNLALHRLIFWQQRKLITTLQGKAIDAMESHFNEYTKSGVRNNDIFAIAEAVREATGNKVNQGLAWRLAPTIRVNCVRLRPAGMTSSVGFSLDILSAAINHSCVPNAHIFFEGTQLRLRSLTKIPAGAELTISYVDPTVLFTGRQELLQREHFFTCACVRCKAEKKELRGFPASLPAAQRSVLTLINATVHAIRSPGLNPHLEDLSVVETELRTVTSTWPNHLDPLPSARLTLANLYLGQDKIPSALRLGLQGMLLARRERGPEWVNDMIELVSVLLVAGNLAYGKALAGVQGFPTLDDLRTVVYGYLYEVCKEAGRAFGGDSGYTMAIGDMFAKLMGEMGKVRPGMPEFKEDFDESQERVLMWAGLKMKGLALTS
ncbi:hypothetical protein OQA88_9556 [Cercophora sp. LCS_1]